jgi:hypothetical protein
MKPPAILILSVFILFLSCKKSEVKSDSSQFINSGFMIKAGFECGWGSGTDTIEISKTMIKYVYYIPSKSYIPQFIKTRAVPDSEWTEIVNDVNYNDFEKLYYQSCDICVDGCDEWIFIKDEQLSHEIRFSKGLRIESISKLQDKLAQLRAEFNK